LTESVRFSPTWKVPCDDVGKGGAKAKTFLELEGGGKD